MSTPSPTDDTPSWDGSLDDDFDDESLLADDLDYGLAADDEEGGSWGLIAGVIVAMAAIGFLVFDGLQAETYFFDVHDAVERGDELIGETVRVRGDVEAGSIEGKDGHLGQQFNISSEGESMTIVSNRALPDSFEEDSEVVAEGVLDENFVLEANEVLVKCPSRYEGAPPTAGDEYDYDGYDNSSEADDPRASR